jgi:hypothetical protein
MPLYHIKNGCQAKNDTWHLNPAQYANKCLEYGYYVIASAYIATEHSYYDYVAACL